MPGTKNPASRSDAARSHRAIGVADDERDDLARSRSASVPTLLAKPHAEVCGGGEKLLAAMRFLLDDVERGDGGGAGGRRLGRREDVGAGAVRQPIDERLRPQTKPPPLPSALLSVPTRMWLRHAGCGMQDAGCRRRASSVPAIEVLVLRRGRAGRRRRWRGLHRPSASHRTARPVRRVARAARGRRPC